MKSVKGDLIKLAIEGEFDVIVHGCNCFCAMGGGIARTIKDMLPQTYYSDLETKKGDRSKLGSYTFSDIEKNGNKFTVINAYTQYKYSGSEINADYNAIYDVFVKIKNDFSGMRIGIPLIGAGLAGGDWKAIESLISTAMIDEDITLVEFDG